MEAALFIPLLFVAVLMLLEPGIVLYDRAVMQNAAAEGCRVLMTLSAAEGDSPAACEEYVRRRLGSVPQQGLFHVHTAEKCSWEIACSGNSASREVSVSIRNKVEPLPLIGFGGSIFGLLDDDGCFAFEVEVRMPVQPDWVAKVGVSSNPEMWIGAWCDGGEDA